MVSQKFVTLSALVLVFAVIATNVGQTNGEKKESKEEEEKDKRMAILSLCVSCPAALNSVNDLKTCLNDNGAAQAVSAATGSDPKQCEKSVDSVIKTLKLDMKKIEPCFDKLEPVEKALNECFKDAKVNPN